MKTKRFLYGIALAVAMSAGFSSCNDFLDTIPDNRTVLDTEEKISNLLVTGYSNTSFYLVNELISDNTDYYGKDNPKGDTFGDETYFWKDVTETGNDGMDDLWENTYNSIAKANQALEALDERGFNDAKGKGIRAEALLLRAYSHFLLVNQFSMAYNSQTSNKDLGIPISTQVEKITVKKDRGTVADVYAQIEKDLEEALPMVTNNYTVPKYHFNQKAAYAFATRFYLYYEKWDKALEYANKCLGSDPSAVLRDWKTIASLANDNDVLTRHYVDANVSANLLLNTASSSSGLYLGAYTYYKRYSHGGYLAKNEDLYAANVWGTRGFYKNPLVMSGNNYDLALFNKIPYMFQYTDQVAGIGYNKTVNALFTTDEVLLNRAEALTMLKRYDEAATDLNTWAHNIVNSTKVLTKANIQTFYNGIDYAYSDADKLKSTQKKHLNPKFSIDAEGSIQETMLQCVLGFRRISTLHEGIRWWDIKRYGIEIPRREMGANGTPVKLLDWLSKDDPRRAIQIPLNIREAGLTPNPRN